MSFLFFFFSSASTFYLRCVFFPYNGTLGNCLDLADVGVTGFDETPAGPLTPTLHPRRLCVIFSTQITLDGKGRVQRINGLLERWPNVP